MRTTSTVSTMAPSGRDTLDAPVGAVRDPSDEAELEGPADDEVTEPDALHPAADGGLQAGRRSRAAVALGGVAHGRITRGQ